MYVRGYLRPRAHMLSASIEHSDNFICPDRTPSFTGFANLSLAVIRLAGGFDKKVVSPRVSCS